MRITRLADSAVVPKSPIHDGEASSQTETFKNVTNTTHAANPTKATPFTKTNSDCLPLVRRKLEQQNLSKDAQEIIGLLAHRYEKTIPIVTYAMTS
jgi:hypothetical protein